jgi:hypothetical protein
MIIVLKQLAEEITRAYTTPVVNRMSWLLLLLAARLHHTTGSSGRSL